MFRYVPLIALAGVLIAACGSSGSSSANNSASKYTQALAFSKCVRSHGVPSFPDPTTGSGGGIHIQASASPSGQSMSVNGVPVNAPAFQTAQKDCAKYLPQGGAHVSNAQLAKLQAAAVKMGECMRSHGVSNFPDPTVQKGPNGGVGIGIKVTAQNGGGPNPQSPAFQSAQKICQPILEKAGGPGAP
jgi:hypothetical protein